jgi:hypothetical protein
MSLTHEQVAFYLDLGPITLAEVPEGQTIPQLVRTEAASFLAACRLELGQAPTLADAEALVWLEAERGPLGEAGDQARHRARS